MNILIYNGAGTNCQSTHAIVQELQQVIADATFIPVSGRFLREEDWEETTHALVMGGGRCSEWEQELQSGMDKIHTYVVNGGRFLGICAGGYFAAHTSYFSSFEPKQRPLQLYPGLAIGPLIEDHLSVESALAAKVDLVYQDSIIEGFSYYQGGPYFEHEDESVTVLARYSGPIQKHAVVSCTVGRGRAVLCGLHPEFYWQKNTTAESEHYRQLSELLATQEAFRKMLWHKMAHALFC